MRGKGVSSAGVAARLGITPAYAGKSKTPDCPNVASEDHPRLCGEKSLSVVWK